MPKSLALVLLANTDSLPSLKNKIKIHAQTSNPEVYSSIISLVSYMSGIMFFKKTKTKQNCNVLQTTKSKSDVDDSSRDVLITSCVNSNTSRDSNMGSLALD